AVAGAVRDGHVLQRGTRLVAHPWLDSALARIVESAVAFLNANSLRSAAPREHVRSASALEPALFDLVVGEAVSAARLVERGANGLAPPGYEVSLTAGQSAQVAAFREAIKSAGASPPTDQIPSPPLLAYMVDQGFIADAGGGIVFDAEFFAAATGQIREYIASAGSISLAEARDLFGTSRKYAQAMLEYLDAQRITRRVGDSRVLR
ncbi:MAG: SelB C-terminal domain-containing protein, partial [Anaerolineaceae bacterium]